MLNEEYNDRTEGENAENASNTENENRAAGENGAKTPAQEHTESGRNASESYYTQSPNGEYRGMNPQYAREGERTTFSSGASSSPNGYQNPYGAYQGQSMGYDGYNRRGPVVNDAPYSAPYGGYSQNPYNSNAAAGAKPKKRSKAPAVIGVILAVILVLGAGIGFGIMIKSLPGSEPAVTTPAGETQGKTPSRNDGSKDTAITVVPQTKEAVLTPSAESTDTFNAAEIYKNNVNSIVGINNNGQTYNIFGQTTETASTGTGFVVKEDGYILTNYHVVSNENIMNPTLTVTLYNGDSYDAKVVGFDEFADVALIKIDATGLTPVTLGNSDNVVPGENVAIIGHPLGQLTYSISKGIISSINRSITIEGIKMDLYQIDAPVNGGNSGGPAFNENGQVIGIVNSKYASSSIEGLGFIIPVNKAVKIANDLINYGFIRDQAGLGVTVKTVYTSNYYSQTPFGAMVQSVNPGSCAEKAGIAVGDVIIKIDDVEVTSIKSLSAAKSHFSAGDTATVTVYRDQKEIELEVTFDEMIPEGYVLEPEKT